MMRAVLRRQAAPLAAVAAGLVVLGFVFAPEAKSAIHVWNSSTAYGHCWLVLPIAVWLLWDRRAILADLWPRPFVWAAVGAVPVAGVWLVSDWLGIMEGRQLAGIFMVELLFLAAFGPRMFRALSVPCLYLVFLVPSGAFITPSLQRFTAGFIEAGLGFLDIPFEADAFRITIPEGNFYVAEACAGLRFLIASVAFGVLYAVTMYRAPWRRAVFILVSSVVPVLANGVRGLGIVLLGHVLGSAQAGAADHLIYGWVFFSAVTLLLAMGGLLLRDPPPGTFVAQPAPAPLRRPGLARSLLACAPVVLIAGLVAGSQAARGGGDVAAVAPRLVIPKDCTAQMGQVTKSVYRQALRCGDTQFVVTAARLPAGSNPSLMLEAGRQAAAQGLGATLDTEAWQAAGETGHPWMLVLARDTQRVAAYAVFSGGRQSIGGLRDRWRMAREMGTVLPVAVAVSASPGADAVEQLKAFLAQQKAVLF